MEGGVWSKWLERLMESTLLSLSFSLTHTHLHLGSPYPSRVSLHRTWPPTWQCRSSRHPRPRRSDGTGWPPEQSTAPHSSLHAAGENRRGKTWSKRVCRVHKSKALIFSLKDFEHIFSRSKESLEEWVHLEWNPKISREIKHRNTFSLFFWQLNYMTSTEPDMTCVNSHSVPGSLKISPLHVWTSY